MTAIDIKNGLPSLRLLRNAVRDFTQVQAQREAHADLWVQGLRFDCKNRSDSSGTLKIVKVFSCTKSVRKHIEFMISRRGRS